MTWISPTGHNDPSSEWSYESRAFDERTSSSTYSKIPPLSWSGFLELTHDALDCDKIRFYALSEWHFEWIDVDIYYEGDWHHVHEGFFADRTWVEKNIPEGQKSVTAARIRFYNELENEVLRARLYEFDFWEVELPPPPPITKLLHVRHPALLTITHKRNGVIIDQKTNLSSLDDQYLTKQVGLDVEKGDYIEATTVAGILYKHLV